MRETDQERNKKCVREREREKERKKETERKERVMMNDHCQKLMRRK